MVLRTDCYLADCLPDTVRTPKWRYTCWFGVRDIGGDQIAIETDHILGRELYDHRLDSGGASFDRDGEHINTVEEVAYESIVERHHALVLGYIRLPTVAATATADARSSQLKTEDMEAHLFSSHDRTAAVLECQPEIDGSFGPTYHVVNNVTRLPSGELKRQPLNDANAIFEYKGIYHAMNQAGGGNWTHAISDDLVRWFHVKEALSVGTQLANRTISQKWGPHDIGPCDGTVSFPEGQPGPIIMYMPDCDDGLDPSHPKKGDDTPRIAISRPADPESPFLLDWLTDKSDILVFDHGPPCSFPGRVWKSKAGEYYNMICAYNAGNVWARYTSSDPALLHWRIADKQFTEPISAGNGLNGPLFHPIPNAAPGGPDHMINADTGDSFYLGVYNYTTEKLNITSRRQTIDSSSFFQFGAVGTASDGRLLTTDWLGMYKYPVNALSSIRELTYDRAVGQLVSRPVAEYASLRTATFVENAHSALPPHTTMTLPVPPGAGGTIDMLVSFDIASVRAANASDFGVAVRAQPNTARGADLAVYFNAIESASDGTKTIRWNVTTAGPVPRGVSAPRVSAFKLLNGETTLDVRILVDRPIVEVFVQGGRGAFSWAQDNFMPNRTAVHLFNAGSANVVARNVSVYGMACGWRPDKPKPKPQ